MGLVASIAITLGKGLATAVAKKIGAEIVDKAFPPEPVEYFDQTTQVLERVVREGITAADIRAITDNINYVKHWVKTTYTHRGDEWGAVRRIDELQMKLDELAKGSLSRLTNPLIAQPGFSVYLVAKGLQLALVQEQDVQNPKTADRPGLSSFGRIRAAEALLGFDFALNTFIDLLIARGNAVKFHLVSPKWSGNKCHWTDRVIGYKSKTYYNQDEARADMEKHRLEVQHKLIEDLGRPIKIAEDWQSLALRYDASPLYMSYTTKRDGVFYDYSHAEDYVARLGIAHWTAHGGLGCMGSKDVRQHGADIPVYRLVATEDPSRVLLRFDPMSYQDAKRTGWNGNGEGRGLIGYLWRDPSRVPVAEAIPVYPLVASSKDHPRSMLATSEAEYKNALSVGWAPAGGGVVGYLCSEG